MSQYHSWNVHAGQRIVGFVDAASYVEREVIHHGTIRPGVLLPAPQGPYGETNSVFIMKTNEDMTSAERARFLELLNSTTNLLNLLR